MATFPSILIDPIIECCSGNSAKPGPSSYNTAKATDYVMRRFTAFTIHPCRSRSHTGIFMYYTRTVNPILLFIVNIVMSIIFALQN